MGYDSTIYELKHLRSLLIKKVSSIFRHPSCGAILTVVDIYNQIIRSLWKNSERTGRFCSTHYIPSVVDIPVEFQNNVDGQDGS